MLSDWVALVSFLQAVSHQLQAHDTSTPLAPQHQQYLRAPITSPLVQQLCNNPRHSPTQRDWWRSGVCNYYKSISWDLPEAGFVMYSFVESLLQLRGVVGSPVLLIFDTAVPVPASDVAVAVPNEYGDVFSNITQVAASGLAVDTLRNVSVMCSVNAAADRHQSSDRQGSGALALTLHCSTTVTVA